MSYRPIVLTRSVEFTRANGTTAYTAGDVVGPATALVLTLPGVGAYPGASGEIQRITLIKSTAGVTNATFRVHFFTSAPTGIADNAAWALMYAQRDRWIASVDLATMVSDGGASDTARTQDLSTRIAFQLPATATDLIAVVTALGAYTPGDSEKFCLEVSVKQN